jgi:hypothetical protein
MKFELTGLLKKVTISQGKADEDGQREPPTATIQLEVPVSRGLGDLAFFVGQEVDAAIKPLQATLGEDQGAPLLAQVR